MNLEDIEDIAERYVKNVCEAGSPGADRHNRKTFVAAIQEALIKHERDRKIERDRKAANQRNARAGRKKLGPSNGAPAMSKLQSSGHPPLR